MARMQFFYVLVMNKRLTFEGAFYVRLYVNGDRLLDKKVYFNGDSLNNLNFLYFKKRFTTAYMPTINEIV